MSKCKYKVMVVDDDESVRDSLQKLLDGEGYDVILVADGIEAVASFLRLEGKVDLLLMDLNMPLKNGWATLDHLLGINPALPVFVVTGLSNQSQLAETAGVNALVEKPIDVPALLKLIKQQLANSIPARLQASKQRVFPFYWLRAARGASQGLGNETIIVSYHHWGLNE